MIAVNVYVISKVTLGRNLDVAPGRAACEQACKCQPALKLHFVPHREHCIPLKKPDRRMLFRTKVVLLRSRVLPRPRVHIVVTQL
jgi:hypothetical protein